MLSLGTLTIRTLPLTLVLTLLLALTANVSAKNGLTFYAETVQSFYFNLTAAATGANSSDPSP